MTPVPLTSALRADVGVVMSEDLLTVPEVAGRLRVSSMTIYRWIEDGTLPALQIRKNYRVRAADLEALLEGARVGGESDAGWGVEPPRGPDVQE